MGVEREQPDPKDLTYVRAEFSGTCARGQAANTLCTGSTVEVFVDKQKVEWRRRSTICLKQAPIAANEHCVGPEV